MPSNPPGPPPPGPPPPGPPPPGPPPPGPPAGYSGTPLPRKLGIGEDDTVAVIGAPDGFADTLGQLPEIAALHTDLADGARYDVILAFVTQRAELEAELPRLRSVMAPACGLWIAWPKKASRRPTDMTDQVVRDVALLTGLVDNKVCAIDETWSGLRLVIRRENR
ncbi:MAG TPA: hypothetical protein VK586_06800 [Streptosporangiaceae bacterium]|nr:hypothetical protein [Streptosporangiaceae bacterium]